MSDHLTSEEIRSIAMSAANEVTNHLLTRIGLDPENIDEHRKNLQWLAAARKRDEDRRVRWVKIYTTLVPAAAMAFLTYVFGHLMEGAPLTSFLSNITLTHGSKQ